MELVIRILTALNILIYVAAFVMGYHRGHSVKIYIFYLLIQAVLLIMQLKNVGYSGKGDAAGNGLEAGFLFLIYFAIQMLFLIILVITFLKKVL